MTPNPLHEKLIEEISKVLKCADTDCDQKGNIPYQVEEQEWKAYQCQYCFEVRLPALEYIRTAFSQIEQATREECKVTENTSDGYHTFKELYEFRKLYNAVLFNEWTKQHKYKVHKSIRHNDGELCFGGGWFIVMAQLPTGQISNHYEMKDWDLFNVAVLDKAEKWDGHTSQDVATRLGVEAITKLTT